MIETIKKWIWGDAPVLWFPDERNYKVIECKAMPSCVGMQMKGVPTLKTRFTIANNKEFRTITPIEIKQTDKGFIVETGKLTIVFEQIA
jgi:hypothetical protein